VFDVLARQLSRGLSRPLSSDLDGITRIVFIDLDDTANAHYLLGTPFAPAGDFEIKVSFETTSTSGNGTLFAGSTQSNNSIVADIQSNGSIRFFAFAGGSLQNVIESTITGLNDGELHVVKLSYIGTTALITIDGTSDNSSTWALTGSENVGRFGSRANGSGDFDGIESDVELIDLTTPANSQYYKLNQLTANSETSGANTLTYQNIATGTATRNTYELLSSDTQWISPLRTIDIAAQA
jgi:hypothetical protein